MAGASKHDWLNAQTTTVLIERLKALKAAWILGNGAGCQPWFNQGGTKKFLLSNILSGFTAFATEPSVTIPVGLQDAIMADDFDFCNCLTRFGLTWTKAQENWIKGCLTGFGLEWARAREGD